MSVIDPQLEQYLENHCSAESELLQRLSRDTYANVLMPRMLSGKVQGRFLSMFAKMLQPKTILELGTFTGYSALCMAEGLAPGGMLHTIDVNEELEEMVASYIKEAGFEGKIKQHIGKALEIIPTLNLTFDLVFIDADKINNLHYYNMVKPMVRPGGVILVDNVLWSGKVAEENAKSSKDTQAILDFNSIVSQDTDMEKMIIPLRDGLFFLRKK